MHLEPQESRADGRVTHYRSRTHRRASRCGPHPALDGEVRRPRLGSSGLRNARRSADPRSERLPRAHSSTTTAHRQSTKRTTGSRRTSTSPTATRPADSDRCSLISTSLSPQSPQSRPESRRGARRARTSSGVRPSMPDTTDNASCRDGEGVTRGPQTDRHFRRLPLYCSLVPNAGRGGARLMTGTRL